MSTAEALADRLRARRQAQGLTVRALAPDVGVAFQSLSGWENGHAQPGLERYEAWAEALGLRFCAVLVDPEADGQPVGAPDHVAALAHQLGELAPGDLALVDALVQRLSRRD